MNCLVEKKNESGRLFETMHKTNSYRQAFIEFSSGAEAMCSSLMKMNDHETSSYLIKLCIELYLNDWKLHLMIGSCILFFEVGLQNLLATIIK